MISKYNNTREANLLSPQPRQNTLVLSSRSKKDIALAIAWTFCLLLLALSTTLVRSCYSLLCLGIHSPPGLTGIDQPLGKKLLLIRLHEEKQSSFLPNPDSPSLLASLAFYFCLALIVFFLWVYFYKTGPAVGYFSTINSIYLNS